jgi:hypothetical protein
MTMGGLRLCPQSNYVDRETALRMWTENVTWFSNEEGKKGRIEVGQFADMIVPDRDLISCAESEIAGMTSDLTVVGGRIVCSSGDFKALDGTAPPPAMPDWSPVRSFGRYCNRGRIIRVSSRRRCYQTKHGRYACPLGSTKKLSRKDCHPTSNGPCSHEFRQCIRWGIVP